MRLKNEVKSFFKDVQDSEERKGVPIICTECHHQFTRPYNRLSKGKNTLECPKCRKKFTVDLKF